MDLITLIFVLIAVSSAISKNKKKAAATRKNVVSPVRKAVPQPATEPLRQELAPHIPAQRPVMAPRVETQLSMADAPALYAGSMNADTHEGEDPCHDEQLTVHPGAIAAAPIPMERPGLTLDWNGDSMVKAFVMQEILARPAQRRR